ncbi:MAG: arginine deiminase family protein [Bacteroidales bacterium]|nr:arginine deiminase family protein [Bacteroidales bacterium]
MKKAVVVKCDGFFITFVKSKTIIVLNMDSKKERIIICAPEIEYFKVTELSKHNITVHANQAKALSQHFKLKDTLIQAGVHVEVIPELEDHPNSVFTRDPSVVTAKGYIRLRMGLESRRGEEMWMAGHLESLGINHAGSIKGNGTVEGGDVILAGRVAFIGRSKRTNQEGIDQLTAILKEINLEVRTIVVPEPFLHLGGAMSVISRDHVLCCQDIFPDTFFEGFKRIELPGADFVTGNVIALRNNEVIADMTNTIAIDILKLAGFRPHAVDLSEFIKGMGGPSCLVLPAGQAG